jgi:hypothetical protein
MIASSSQHDLKGPYQTLVYTAIFGDKNVLTAPRVTQKDVAYVCMTDDRTMRSDVWDVVHCDRLLPHPCRAAKIYKAMPHRFFRCKQSVWIDGSMEPRESLVEMFNQFDELVALRRHSDRRKCAYDEARICRQGRRDKLKAIERTVTWLRQIGHRRNAGLAAGGVIFRRHNAKVDAFGEAWWKAICHGSYRDQITLIPCLNRSGVSYHLFPPEKMEDLVIRHQHRHKRRSHGLPV